MTLDGVSKPLRRRAIGRWPAADPAAAGMHRDEGGTSQATASVFTACLTIDVTPALRKRIKGDRTPARHDYGRHAVRSPGARISGGTFVSALRCALAICSALPRLGPSPTALRALRFVCILAGQWARVVAIWWGAPELGCGRRLCRRRFMSRANCCHGERPCDDACALLCRHSRPPAQLHRASICRILAARLGIRVRVIAGGTP